jgi:hypothetical protein
MPIDGSIWKKWNNLSAPLSLSRSCRSMKRGVLRSRQTFTQLENAQKLGKNRVVAVRSIESAAVLRPTPDEADRMELAQFILHRGEGQPAHIH